MSNITIVYCVPCGYLKRATEAAEALTKNLNITPTLIPGKGGIFQVKNGEQILTKRTATHFPDTKEIVEVVSAALSVK